MPLNCLKENSHIQKVNPVSPHVVEVQLLSQPDLHENFCLEDRYVSTDVPAIMTFIPFI